MTFVSITAAILSLLQLWKSEVKQSRAQEYAKIIVEESQAMQPPIDPYLVVAIIFKESSFRPKVEGKRGEVGLMQIMPQNLEAFRVHDPFDPWQNIMGGARYLKALILRFNGQVPLALAAYNAGPRAVDTHRGIPPIRETEEYVKRVMKYFYLYKKG